MGCCIALHSYRWPIQVLDFLWKKLVIFNGVVSLPEGVLSETVASKMA